MARQVQRKKSVVLKGATNEMVRLNMALDPTRTGREAESLESNLCKLIVGQDEAIQQIVNIYQMHLTGMNPPARPIGEDRLRRIPHEIAKLIGSPPGS
jgi:ATP-dependent Clp protease ATP-binding subunit ClpA